MSAVPIEEMHTMRLKDLTHEVLTCECAIYTFPVWASVQGAPELKLKSVVFELNGRVGEGVEVLDARDHAVFLAQFRRDKRERMSWPDIEEECARIYFDGMSPAVERDIDHGDEIKHFPAAGCDPTVTLATSPGCGNSFASASAEAQAEGSGADRTSVPAATFLDGRAA